MRILVVEDFQMLRESLTQGLREEGFAVDAAPDGKEGLWQANSGQYDVIILDLRTGQVVSRTDIWEHVYDFNSAVESNVVDVFIGHLRKKIERQDLPKLIHTRRGQGYVLAEAKEPVAEAS